MRIFAAILKNDFRRLMERKSKFILFFVLTAGAIAVAIFMNTKADIVGHIAVVSKNDVIIPSTHLNITPLEKAPPTSDLVAGKYDAVVSFDVHGRYEIQTIKNDDFKQMLDTIISDPSSFHTSEIGGRDKGTNIIGFIMMFILMQGVSMTFMFAEDKDKKQIKRIAASPVSFMGYLYGHSFFTFIFLLMPTIIILLAVKLLFSINIGFAIMEYFFLTAILSALATSFALFLIALIKAGDFANMIGSAIIILTSILAGSFYSFDKGNKVLETVIKVLPQKAFLSMSELLEAGKDISLWYHHGLYIVVLIIIFFIAAMVKTRMDYVKN